MSNDHVSVINIASSNKDQIIDITKDVSDIVRASGTTRGIVFVFVPHTTAGLTVNENADPDVKKDILMGLDNIVSKNLSYSHAEGNSTSHIKASLMGSSVTLFIENSKLVLGSWQGIYFCEFDGPRNRKIFVKATGC